MVQLLTGVPSKSTVQAPQLVVSQPVCVPVSLKPWRSRWASSSRGSTSAARGSPLMVTLTRRVGTSAAGAGRTSSNRLMSGRPSVTSHIARGAVLAVSAGGAVLAVSAGGAVLAGSAGGAVLAVSAGGDAGEDALHERADDVPLVLRA